jgi:DHA2 family multidrug resistance protein
MSAAPVWASWLFHWSPDPPSADGGYYIITNWDWRMVFFINLPIGVAAVILAMLLLRPGRRVRDQRFDTVGFVLSSFAFGSLLYALSQVSSSGWSSPVVRSPLGVGGLSLIGFIVYELRRGDPLLDVRLLLIPQYLHSSIVGWVTIIALFGAEFMVPLYLQNLRGLSAVNTGLSLMPQGLATAIAGPNGGRLVDRVGARWIVMFGLGLLVYNTYELSRITLTTDYRTLLLLLAVRAGWAARCSRRC